MILMITAVIPRPISGSAMRNPSATTTALATTPSETKASIRPWFPSATRAGLSSRLPPRSRTRAATSLPTNPIRPMSPLR